MTGPTALPFVTSFAFDYGAPMRLSDRITRVIARNPGPFTYTGTGTYIVAHDGAAAVIDPGPELIDHHHALIAALDGRPVSHVLVTHTHRDHCALARAFADAVGAPVCAFGAHPARDPEEDAPALEEGGDYGFRPDLALAGGERLQGEGWTISAVHTPGHLSNHLCFSLDEEGALFTGDHVMGWATTVIAPPDGDMGAYLGSLDALLAREDRIYLPTHGAPIEKPKAFVRAVRAHRAMRDGQILAELRKGRTRIKDIVGALYADVDPRLHGAAALNVFAHLIRLVNIGEAVCDGAPAMAAQYGAAR